MTKSTLKFPLIKCRQDYFPIAKTGVRCPICKVGRIMEPHSFACLNGGALALDRRRRNSVDAILSGFLDITWHGAHTEHKGVGALPDTYERVSLVEDSHTGQFELYFCSTKCLRKFFNQWVDALDGKLVHRKKTSPITKRRNAD